MSSDIVDRCQGHQANIETGNKMLFITQHYPPPPAASPDVVQICFW